jgi:hypothetical protein
LLATRDRDPVGGSRGILLARCPPCLPFRPLRAPFLARQLFSRLRGHRFSILDRQYGSRLVCPKREHCGEAYHWQTSNNRFH